jgi:hypothetical protein
VNVYLEKESSTMDRRNVLIGGAAAGILAIVCLWTLVNTLKRTEKRK